ncbi:ROK family transcriptional regulator [Thermotoga maritima MSB8]|uniref:Transcriptional regulator, XylR-related n=1 Tax=Thermotoga maritima (strain ATCC 43589 / DSM 3109 / JCM 10099 / NBRC 100826 / MSB8) TaxID=243274 RepID=Q9WXW5_THEMA|nr:MULTISPECIES: ROK family transcriptional regulator [Thermotoga]AAD35204.1 transcriptional regulator, XylR-related [Thermotoga maritima MSB8]AGL49033.1 Xylose repressor XylR (ROK family) [Thermotoga maritima MSB8]AHD18121.1 ROK family transcriptional regulator [Thermotoga maritima MSB8]AIY86394.1 XylR family transcriptional regulator [Thermotoga sp. 2812B]AKE26055.1 ROK family transcriptional regulator [Thermotoga maritima]
MKYNSPRIKILNKKSILKVIHENHPISRSDISEVTGLTPSSVTRLTKELIDEGYIREIGTMGKNSPGRRRILLDLRKNAFLSLVFDIGVNITTYGIGFFDGEVEPRGTFNTPKEPVEFFNIVKEIYERISGEYRISRISLSVPGMVDMEEKKILLAPNLEWENVNIKELLKVDVPVLADNEANLSMLAEKYHSEDLRNVKEAVFIIIREGVGTGLMIDGKIFRGPSFTAGEAGHMTVNMYSDRQCHCSNWGCWELVSSINWTIEQYGKELPGKNAIEKFQALKQRNDAKRILMKFAENIAVGIVNLVNILNPELVILGGEVVDLGENFLDIIKDFVHQRALKAAVKDLKIRTTEFRNISSNLVGAAVLAVEDIIEEVK